MTYFTIMQTFGKMPLRMCRSWVIVSFVLARLVCVAAEQLTFHEPAPEALTLKIFRMLGVVATPENPGYFQISAHVSGGSTLAASLGGLQVIAAEKDWFDHTSSRDSFCCTQQHISEGKCSQEKVFVGASEDGNGPAYSVPVTTDAHKITKLPFHQSGVFYIGLVHCGDTDLGHLEIIGNVQSKSSHGYLSGLDVQAMHFTGGLSIFYCVALAFWMHLCCKFKSQLVSVHYCLSLVLCCCFVASMGKWMMYSLGNHSELSPRSAEVLSEMLGIIKFGVGLVAAVMISLGFGTAHESVTGKEFTWLMVYCVAFCTCAVVRILLGAQVASMISTDLEGPLEGTGSPSALAALVSPHALLVLPEALIFGAIANWGYTALVSLQDTLEQQKQHETLRVMSGFYRTMRGALISLVGILCVQIGVQNTLDGAAVWPFLWILDEGAPNVIYAVCVSCTLLSFWPSENFKAKAMSQQIQFDDNELDDIIGASHPDGIEMADMEAGSPGGESEGNNSNSSPKLQNSGKFLE
ncbi:unnamed protein product [Amoebophrya sp. A120]|nr:unnamed protein product [Amoebophrya sp. A120]|eukprot:GSA120T00002877001.1